jgi:hypothetical protein
LATKGYCWQHSPWRRRIGWGTLIAAILGTTAFLGNLADILGYLQARMDANLVPRAGIRRTTDQPTWAYPSVRSLQSAVEEYVAVKAPGAQLLEIRSDSISQEELDVFPYNTLPVFRGWRFLYRSEADLHRGTEITVLEEGVLDAKSIGLSESQAGLRELSRWAIDLSQILEATSAAQADFLEGSSFRLTMQNVNGLYRPVWYVPYNLKTGEIFVVDAATGQLLCKGDDQLNKWDICDVEPQ